VSKQAAQQRHAVPSTDQFTQRAKNALRNASTMAVSLGHNFVGTEHLLLGLLAYGEGVGPDILAASGVTLEHARAETIRRLSGLR